VTDEILHQFIEVSGYHHYEHSGDFLPGRTVENGIADRKESAIVHSAGDERWEVYVDGERVWMEVDRPDSQERVMSGSNRGARTLATGGRGHRERTAMGGQREADREIRTNVPSPGEPLWHEADANECLQTRRVRAPPAAAKESRRCRPACLLDPRPPRVRTFDRGLGSRREVRINRHGSLRSRFQRLGKSDE
jgi:hypothetical protein